MPIYLSSIFIAFAICVSPAPIWPLFYLSEGISSCDYAVLIGNVLEPISGWLPIIRIGRFVSPPMPLIMIYYDICVPISGYRFYTLNGASLSPIVDDTSINYYELFLLFSKFPPIYPFKFIPFSEPRRTMPSLNAEDKFGLF